MDSLSSIIFLSFLFLSIPPSSSQNPKALVSPVTKDPTTLQYIIRVSQRTPLVSENLVLDLGSRYLWVDCDKGYVSSTYKPARCHSAQCSLANSNSCGDCFSPPRPGCNNNTCGTFPENPFVSLSTGGELATDVISFASTNGSSIGPPATDPHFIFSCAPTLLLKGLASGATGIAALGRTKVALPEQLAAAFSLQRKFALCLSPSTGALFFGGGPYIIRPEFDLSQTLSYTPLLVNPVSTAGTSVKGEKSVEYFIGLKSIEIDNKPIKINPSLLTIDSKGNGGTKISLAHPYTLLESSTYKAVIDAFTAGLLSSIKRVQPVSPFKLCFDPSTIPPTGTGPAVPLINSVLEGGVGWAFSGGQSMILVNKGALCLGIFDAGTNPRTPFIIGGNQAENNLLEFDMARSRLGFRPVLFPYTCAAFNFTANA